jgi:hypothetical protein
MGTRRNDPPRPATCHATWRGGEGGGGGTRYFSKSSLIKEYFKILISHKRRVMLSPFLLQCQSSPISFLRAVMRENVSYMLTRAYKRPAEMACLSLSVTLRFTGYISAEGSLYKNKADNNSTCGTVSSLLFFPPNILLHAVYILSIFMWTEVINLWCL